MQLVDLVLQGVRRFSQSQKIPFKPGFNLVFGGNESGKTTLFECLVELLFPNRIVDVKKDWVTWKSSGQSRAGLTIQHGESFYRILKDFNQNLLSLSRKGPGQDKFERLSSEPSEISALLSEELSLPSYQDYKTLFLESRFWLPSYVGMEKTPEPVAGPVAREDFGQTFKRELVTDLGAGGFPAMSQPGFGDMGMPGMSGPGYPGMPGTQAGSGIPGFGMPGVPGISGLGMPGTELLGEDDGLSWEDKQKRLEELKAQLKKIQDAEDIQFEIDGYNNKIFEIEKEKERFKKIDEEIALLNTELEKYRFFRNLPENIDQRIAQYDSIEVNRAKDLEALNAKMVALDEELRYYESLPKFYEPILFKLGAGLIGAGILSLILSKLLTFTFLQWLGILLAPGVLLIGIALWQFLSAETKRTELRDQLKRMEDKQKSIIKEYQVKGAIVKRLMEQTNCDDTRELKEMLETYRELERKRTELSRKKKEMQIELDIDKLNREQEELKAKIAPLEEKLRVIGIAGIDKTELNREIAMLESSLQRAKQLGLLKPKVAESVQASQPAQTNVPDAGKTQMVAGAPRGAMPFWEQILDSGARLFGFEKKEMLGQILARANLYLQTLSAKRYLEFRLEADQVLVKLGDMDHEQELSQLGKTAANLVYFSLKFAFLEMAIQKYQFPILLDDPYVVLDETKFLTVAKTLKRISARTQVVLFSSQKIFAQEADQALSLS